MDTLISVINSHWFWFAAALILLIFEVLVSGGFLLWIGISAACVGILVWLVPGISLTNQFIIFGIGAVLVSVAWWAYLRKNPIKTDRPHLNRRSERYIGRVFSLEEPIVNGRGRVRVGDSLWQVSGADLPRGSRVKVVAVEGVVLKVVLEQD